ncbi:kelch-like protein 10 isoform X1 [Perca flavescens]|uniref:kelch-like protein 10 isoform X1 n=1 Tax=Perca flavescens TaxID=8167 RepID=UPI00106ECA56|nr:kelch-like protein 10 isoform X1 [Perca flavescens]
MSELGKSHKSNLVFNDLRLEGEFCDAVIKVEDFEFQIHRIVLCKCSPYFLALFRRWSTPDKKVFDIPGLSPDMMQLIIEFAYTGSVSVTEDNAQELLLAADQLNVMDIVQIGCEFLGEQLCPKNCIGIFQFTNICFSSELQHKAYRCIIDHFEEVVFSEEFLQLSVQELTDILDRDDLNVRKESAVYESILRWITHVPEKRKGHITVLLSKVRLALTGMDYMRINVMSNQLVNSNTECHLMVKEAIETICHNTTSSVSGLCNPLSRPRLPNAIMLAIGGWSGGDPTNGIEAYDIRADYWINVTNDHERPRAYHGTAFLNGNVYCVGGFDRVEHFNSVRRFDLSTHFWHEVASMYYRRCYVSVTVLNGCIYAMGGYDGHTRLNTAERYKPENNQWSLIAPMTEHRSDASCTTLHNKVYICGGFNGNECLQTAECYSPETNQWTIIGPMNCRRSGIGVIAYADHVYAVGGFDGNTRLRSAEAYNPQTNTWLEVSSMLTPRSNFGIEVLDDQLFAVGGFNGYTTSYNVESYDATTDEWSEACDMEIFRSALSCCVVYGLPNMADYVVPRDALLRLHAEDETVESVESGESV